ncbi:hypothetical protein JEU11_01955 [Paraglaciecola chathamensis]|jgi:hypothetical protein|uniref:Uncharacterized protein n=1 Tax=Paraglaciecola chathamensis TaxID=368405 RepID=A0ABS0W8V7_9ALTE|nr:hypothetical protein [Paraglaciecola chathamensis]MBJ2135210.1 hypothetical protein [Paraglaciecola chathamensis]
MDMKKVVLVGAILLAVVYIGGSMMATQKAEEVMQGMVNESASFGVDITYDDLSASVLGSVSISELVIDTSLGKVLIDELYIDEYDQEDAFISELSLTADEIEVTGFPIRANPRDLSEALLFLLQQEDKSADLALSIEIDLEEDEVELENLSIEGDDIGELRMSLNMTGLEKIRDLDNQNALLIGTVLLQDLVVNEASLYLDDEGILQALLESEAQQKGVTAQSLRDQAVERGKLAKDKASDKYQQQLAEAGIALLEGDSITLTLDSETPVKLGPLLLSNGQGMQRELQKLKFDLDID